MLTDRLALPETRKPPRPRSETKFDRLQRVRAGHPQCVLTSERVDTDGCFTFMGCGYRMIPDSISTLRTIRDMERNTIWIAC
jgi:hypothetical protein